MAKHLNDQLILPLSGHRVGQLVCSIGHVSQLGGQLDWLLGVVVTGLAGLEVDGDDFAEELFHVWT